MFVVNKPAHNTGFASGRVTCKLGALCFYSSSVLVGSFVLRNPPIAKPENVSGKFNAHHRQTDIEKHLYNISLRTYPYNGWLAQKFRTEHIINQLNRLSMSEITDNVTNHCGNGSRVCSKMLSKSTENVRLQLRQECRNCSPFAGFV